MWNATNWSKSQYETFYILGYIKMTKSDKIYIDEVCTIHSLLVCSIGGMRWNIMERFHPWDSFQCLVEKWNGTKSFLKTEYSSKCETERFLRFGGMWWNGCLSLTKLSRLITSTQLEEGQRQLELALGGEKQATTGGREQQAAAATAARCGQRGSDLGRRVRSHLLT
jgi:hypothetical protein